MILPTEQQQFNSQGDYTYLLTQQYSPSWEANWFAASQEIPRISRNPKVHYRTHKRPPPVTGWHFLFGHIYRPKGWL